MAATQAELQSSETKVVRMQNENNDVRSLAQNFAESAGAEKRKQSQEASALVIHPLTVTHLQGYTF